jgi:hypothetical protein
VLISRVIIKSQDRLTERLEVRGSFVGISLHDETEQTFVPPKCDSPAPVPLIGPYGRSRLPASGTLEIRSNENPVNRRYLALLRLSGVGA